jgi:hypothetical protein
MGKINMLAALFGRSRRLYRTGVWKWFLAHADAAQVHPADVHEHPNRVHPRH